MVKYGYLIGLVKLNIIINNRVIYVFNLKLLLQTYTQYIPLSVYDLQTWMGAPSIYVYDCSNAGIIVESFQQFAEQHEKEYEVHLEKVLTKICFV